MSEIYTISKKDLFDLFSRLSGEYRIFVPYRKGERLYFGLFDQKKESDIELGGTRQSEPLKSFFNPARESILGGGRRDEKPVIVAGVKGCDLSSLLLQDFVFEKSDPQDLFYVKNRKNTILIGHDCTYARETCFCVAMEGAPYPRKSFDISLSPLDEMFIVEVGSEKGRMLIGDFKMFFKSGAGADLKRRDENRQAVEQRVKEYVKARATPDTKAVKGAVEKNYELLELWKDFSSTCVECGACNLVCPTCHCFLLSDEKDGERPMRHRQWDACLYKSFARVAGGANPRKHLHERMRNRFDKKFNFFPQVLDYFACTGCGRCIEACPGDIDIREVLKGLVNGKWNKPPND